MKKNPFIENIRIQKVGYKWVGIAALENGKKILVKGNVVPGATATVRIVKKKKGVLLAEVVRITDAPRDRVDQSQIACDHYADPLWTSEQQMTSTSWCGGCKRQVIPYEKQLEIKREQVRECFVAHGIDPDLVTHVLPSPELYRYRNKIEFSFGKYISRDGDDEHRQLGFHKPGMFSKVLDVQQCHLISSKAHELYTRLRALCQSSWLPVYDSKTQIGFRRHLVIRQGINTDQFLVNLSIATKYLTDDALTAKRDAFVETLQQDTFLREQITTMCVTSNNGLADIIRNPDATLDVLWGDGFFFESLRYPAQTSSYDDLDGETAASSSEAEDVEVTFRVSPFSFFQTNTRAAELLFRTAVTLLPEIRGTILDLYCGAWSIGMSLLAQWKGDHVVGIEIVEEAIVDAKHNADINGLSDKTDFFAGKAEQLVFREPKVKEILADMWLVVVDPPRDGMHKSMITFLKTIKQYYACPLLYISCNPVTLARDLELLAEQWWEIETVQAVDMFPHTYHVETIVILR